MNPITVFVCESVAQKLKLAGMFVPVSIPQFLAISVLALMMVANTSTALPTCTERLAGKTKATTSPVAPRGEGVVEAGDEGVNRKGKRGKAGSTAAVRRLGPTADAGEIEDPVCPAT